MKKSKLFIYNVGTVSMVASFETVHDSMKCMRFFNEDLSRNCNNELPENTFYFVTFMNAMRKTSYCIEKIGILQNEQPFIIKVENYILKELNKIK